MRITGEKNPRTVSKRKIWGAINAMHVFPFLFVWRNTQPQIFFVTICFPPVFSRSALFVDALTWHPTRRSKIHCPLLVRLLEKYRQRRKGKRGRNKKIPYLPFPLVSPCSISFACSFFTILFLVFEKEYTQSIHLSGCRDTKERKYINKQHTKIRKKIYTQRFPPRHQHTLIERGAEITWLWGSDTFCS